MVQQFLFDGIVQVHVLVEKQVFFEQEYMTVFANRLRSVGRPRVGVSVPLPFRHDIGQFFFGHQTPLGVAQHFIDRVSCTVQKNNVHVTISKERNVTFTVKQRRTNGRWT